MIERMTELAEKACLKVYRLVKRAYLRVRFGGRISLAGVGFRRPFYCRVGPHGRIALGGGYLRELQCEGHRVRLDFHRTPLPDRP